MEITPETLRRKLRYAPNEGKLFWRPTTPDMYTPGKKSATHQCNAWNARYANKEAFTATDAHGYKVGTLSRKCLKAHRVVWAIVYGEWPSADIDHINKDRADNRISNLRAVTRAQNLANSHRARGTTSVYRGVRYSFGKWEARISVDNRQVSLGRFDEEAAAARVYDAKARALWGECATLNFS